MCAFIFHKLISVDMCFRSSWFCRLAPLPSPRPWRWAVRPTTTWRPSSRNSTDSTPQPSETREDLLLTSRLDNSRPYVGTANASVFHPLKPRLIVNGRHYLGDFVGIVQLCISRPLLSRRLKLHIWVKLILHTEQRTPVWGLWVFKLPAVCSICSHSGSSWMFFSPVWILWCLFKSPAWILAQFEQLKVPLL